MGFTRHEAANDELLTVFMCCSHSHQQKRTTEFKKIYKKIIIVILNPRVKTKHLSCHNCNIPKWEENKQMSTPAINLHTRYKFRFFLSD